MVHNVYSKQNLLLAFLLSKSTLYAFVFLGDPLKIVHVEVQT